LSNIFLFYEVDVRKHILNFLKAFSLKVMNGVHIVVGLSKRLKGRKFNMIVLKIIEKFGS